MFYYSRSIEIETPGRPDVAVDRNGVNARTNGAAEDGGVRDALAGMATKIIKTR